MKRYAPIPLSLPTGNFLSPLPLRVRAKTLVSSRGGGRSAMATSEHSTAPRSSPAQHGCKYQLQILAANMICKYKP